jgi:hypothetical protein
MLGEEETQGASKANRCRKPNLLVALTVVSVVLGVLFAGFFMMAAWNHNPQGEFHSEEGIQWANWLEIGIAAFVVAEIPVAAGWIANWVRERKHNRAVPRA